VLAEQIVQIQKTSAVFKYPQVERKKRRPGNEKKNKETTNNIESGRPQGDEA